MWVQPSNREAVLAFEGAAKRLLGGPLAGPQSGEMWMGTRRGHGGAGPFLRGRDQGLSTSLPTALLVCRCGERRCWQTSNQKKHRDFFAFGTFFLIICINYESSRYDAIYLFYMIFSMILADSRGPCAERCSRRIRQIWSRQRRDVPRQGDRRPLSRRVAGPSSDGLCSLVEPPAGPHAPA